MFCGVHAAVQVMISIAVAMQEAYIRGVSGWNFDVSALKKAASELDTPSLTPIAETPG